VTRIALIATLALAIPTAALAGSAPQTTKAPERSAAPQQNIVGTAAAAGSFKTLLSLAKQAGLVGALSGPTKLTVFAPTDAAFKKVPKATLAKLGTNRALLRRVLLYHVVKGSVPAAKVVVLRSAKTLAGPSVRIRVEGKTVRVNQARVVKTDIKATNGIIHVVDSVLIPPA
jgi:uncharacterized surface protein with fasciclin (FAS1) repeats